MQILSAADIKAVDLATMQVQGLESHELMERAATQLVASLWKEKLVVQGHTQKIGLLCGNGNNGGDGLAMARLLHEQGFDVQVYHVSTDQASADNQLMRSKLPNGIAYHAIDDQFDLSEPDIEGSDLIIDALFGAGLSRPIEGHLANLITHINESQSAAKVVSIDLPSGLPTETEATGAVIHADHTLCIGLPKLNLFFAENEKYIGEWTLVDIDLDPGSIAAKKALAHYARASEIKSLLKTRQRFGHKGTFGHVGIIAGSHGKIGAAILSVRAALRSGAGLVTAQVPTCGYALMQTSVPEAMCQVDEHAYALSRVGDIEAFSALAIGPGLGQNPLTVNALDDLLDRLNKPLVVDADALNILARQPEWIKRLPKNSILTPHPGEFDRLFGKHNQDFRRWITARERASKLGLIIVLKGGYTSIHSPHGEVYINSTGNPGMGTAGSGDVLTGIIAGLLAQNYDPLEAARLGVYLHGLAGDLAAQHEEQEAVIAGDIIAYLGSAFKHLRQATS